MNFIALLTGLLLMSTSIHALHLFANDEDALYETPATASRKLEEFSIASQEIEDSSRELETATTENSFTLQISTTGTNAACSTEEHVHMRSLIWELIDTELPIALGVFDEDAVVISLVEETTRRNLREIGQQALEQFSHRRLYYSGYRGSGHFICGNGCNRDDDGGNYMRNRRATDLELTVAASVREGIQQYINATPDFCLQGDVAASMKITFVGS